MRIVFMGTPVSAAVSLGALLDDGHDVAAVYTQPDRPAGRGKKLQESPVKLEAQRHGIRVEQPTRLRDPEVERCLLDLAADCMVVVAYGRILPSNLLSACRLGAVNVHFSLLPKYRGAAPVNWAIANGETVTGVTTMLMDEGLDTGPMLLHERTPIGPEETAPELMERLAVMGGELLVRTLRELPVIEPREQDGVSASYAPILKREDGCVNWMLAARDIVNRLRGFQPFPGSFSFLNGQKVTFWKAEAEDTGGGKPGEITVARGDDLIIGCGEGCLRIREIQFEGKRRMPARDAINGMRLRAGMRFGPPQEGF
jgi:methionyl-tRNA formyltransferase